jgi:serine protease Do
VIADDGTLITASPSESAPSFRVFRNGSSVPVNLLTWGAGLPFTIARVPYPITGIAATTVPSSRITPGAWILLVSFGSSGGVVLSPGSYGGQGERLCGLREYPVLHSNIPLDADSVGGGLFDFDGNLLAIVVGCDQEPAAIPVDALRAAAASESQSLAMLQLGFLAADVNQTWAPLLSQSSRVVVTDVWQGWPASTSGLEPGDVIVRVNGEPVQNLDQLVSLIGNGTGVVTFNIQKGPRTVRKVLTRNAPPAGAAQFQAQTAGTELRRVPEDSALARAGFRAGDQLLSLNGTIATSTNFASMLSTAELQHPALLVAQRGGRTFARVVTP